MLPAGNLHIERAARVLEVRPCSGHHPMKAAILRITAPVASDEHEPRRNDIAVGAANDTTHASGCKTGLARSNTDSFPSTSSPTRGRQCIQRRRPAVVGHEGNHGAIRTHRRVKLIERILSEAHPIAALRRNDGNIIRARRVGGISQRASVRRPSLRSARAPARPKAAARSKCRPIRRPSLFGLAR